MKSEGVGLIVRAISFQDFQPMWSWTWSTNVTDGQKDDMQSQYRALHWSASRGKNVLLRAALNLLTHATGWWVTGGTDY